MEGNKSKENRKGNNRRRGGRKEEKRELRRTKNSKSEEIASPWPPFLDADDIESTVSIVEQEKSLNLENFDNGNEKIKSSLMCPNLRRQLQTHKNVLRMLHEYKLASTQINGQRILSIQPVRWSGPTPGINCEIFVGRIPKTIYEDVLYPLFNTVGEVFQIRLMVDMAELTRGYCFIMYTNPEDAARAIVQLDQYEISPGRKIRVLASVNKCKLYVGLLPRHIASEEVVRVIYASAWDIEYVSIYRFPNHDAAYAIISFKSHRNAALARRKLRPERLFKCNEVHVEWARVDWNPSNVYEDRGTVDDKGDVQITRRYLQPKKTSSTTTTTTSNTSITMPESPIAPNDSKDDRKQIPPICPPNGGKSSDNGQVNDPSPPVVKSSSRSRNATRYSTMLAMSAMDEVLFVDGSEFTKPPPPLLPQVVLTDINDNVQPLHDGHCHFRDKMQPKKEGADVFPNFDMWNSNLMPALPQSPPKDSDSRRVTRYEPLDKLPKKSLRERWETGAECRPSRLSTFVNGYASGNNVASLHPANCSFSARKTVNQSRPIAAVRCEQNYPACYVLVQSSPACLYPAKDITCPSKPLSLAAHHDYRLYGQCNEQIEIREPYSSSCSVQIDGEKLYSDYEIWRGGGPGVLTKVMENGNGMPRPPADPFAITTSPSSSYYVQNYAPNLVLNFTPIRTSASAPGFVLSDLVNDYDDKRPRPILKQETVRV